MNGSFGVNAHGPYFLTQAIANWMIEQKRALSGYSRCIINISSISATVASVNRGEYCISKAAIAMASLLWATRLAEFEIPVYEVRPGIIETDMTAGVRPKYDALIEQGLLLQKRWGTPQDVGKAVAMLARGDLPYSTGQVVVLDGGMTVFSPLNRVESRIKAEHQTGAKCSGIRSSPAGTTARVRTSAESGRWTGARTPHLLHSR